MPFVRAQCVLPYFTNLPRDVATNTLYFGHEDPLSPESATDLITKLMTAYSNVDQFLSPILTGDVNVNLFQMEDAPPRQPYLPGWTFGITTATSDGDIEELAVCLSFKASPSSGVSPARQRGRIYIGPLTHFVHTYADGDSFTEITSTVQDNWLDMAEALADQSDGWTWVIHSEAGNAYYPVVSAWVDNAPDTQRRRGFKATSRATRDLL